MKVKILVGIAVIISIHTKAQTAGKPNKFEFKAQHHVGLLSGASGESANIQSVHGFSKGTWFAGLGVGLDFYEERSVPLFLSITKDLNKTGKTPFFYANGGVNFPWLTENQKGWRQIEQTDPGAYYDFGGGYKIRLKYDQYLLFSAGFSHKTNRIYQTQQFWIGPGTEPLTGRNLIVSNFNRVNLKVGVMF